MKHLPHLIVTCAFALLLSRAPAPADTPSTDPLKVVAVASKDKVHIKETFKVMLRVENVTTVPQKIRVMTCSWFEHWQSSNRQVSYVVWMCGANVAVNETIAPGRAYTCELKMLVLSPADIRLMAGVDPSFATVKPVTAGPLTFKMGFTPGKSAKTYWSNDVKIEVIP